MHIDRVRTRVLEGGHFIATEDIIRRYDVSLRNLKGALKVADVSIVIDNSRDEYDNSPGSRKVEIQYRVKLYIEQNMLEQLSTNEPIILPGEIGLWMRSQGFLLK